MIFPLRSKGTLESARALWDTRISGAVSSWTWRLARVSPRDLPAFAFIHFDLRRAAALDEMESFLDLDASVFLLTNPG